MITVACGGSETSQESVTNVEETITTIQQETSENNVQSSEKNDSGSQNQDSVNLNYLPDVKEFINNKSDRFIVDF